MGYQPPSSTMPMFTRQFDPVPPPPTAEEDEKLLQIPDHMLTTKGIAKKVCAEYRRTARIWKRIHALVGENNIDELGKVPLPYRYQIKDVTGRYLFPPTEDASCKYCRRVYQGICCPGCGAPKGH